MRHEDPFQSSIADDGFAQHKDALTVGMVVQRTDRTIEAFNEAATQILGLTAEQLVGASLSHSWQTIREDGSPFPGEQHPAAVALRTGQPCLNVTMGFYKPDGELVWLNLNSQPLFQLGAAVPCAAVTTFFQQGRAQTISDSPSSNHRIPAEAFLRNQEQQIASILAKVPDVISRYDRALRYLYVSPEIERVTGIAPQEFMGKSHAEMGFSAELVADWDANLQAVLATGEERSLEFCFPGIGGVRYYDAKLIPEFGEAGSVESVLVISRNMTDRKRAEDERKRSEEALKQSELLFRNLADTMPQIFWVTQPDGYHEYFNQRWYEYTGTTLEQARGDGWSHILHPDDYERTFVTWQESLRTGNFYNIDYRFRRAADGQYRWFVGRAFPLRDETGRIVKWFGSCTDIHDQKCAIAERDHALERERAARTQAETANHIKDEFLAVLSHELRSPLNPILGWTKLLKSGKCDAATRDRALDIIERNAKLQSQLIEDLLDVSRILRGKLKLVFAPVNLETTIEAALETVRLLAEAKNIEVMFESQSEGNPVLGSGDFNRLQQVVWNLLSNAVKFTPNGGQVNIQLEQTELERSLKPQNPDLKPQNSFAQITITDTGKGISPDFLPHIFEQFRQADSSITRSFGGLGLGLAIVRQIVELHGGTIQAESLGEGLGATFRVRLPLRQAQEMGSQDLIYPTSPSPMLPLSHLQILVVDDDADSREILTFILQEQGAIVTTAASAKAALVNLTGDLIPGNLTQAQPDIILSDLGMPEIDGYSFLRQVRTLPPEQGGEIPAIAVTAYARDEDREGAMAAGFQDYLTKPIDSAALVATIRRVAGRSQS